MRTATEPTCNLTLTRPQWAALVTLLGYVHGDVSVKVRQAINGALASDDGEAVSIERDVEKWTTVLQLVNRVPLSFKREYNAVVQAMTIQLSAAMHRRGA